MHKSASESQNDASAASGSAIGIDTSTDKRLAPRTSLTPCILDRDPVQLQKLSAVIAEMGYEPIPTLDP
jgi:hypothetical protein